MQVQIIDLIIYSSTTTLLNEPVTALPLRLKENSRQYAPIVSSNIYAAGHHIGKVAGFVGTRKKSSRLLNACV